MDIKDTTKAWLIIGAILLGSAEPSPADWSNQQYRPQPQQRESDADYYARHNYFMLQQQQFNDYLQRRQYEQDKRNYEARERQQIMMDAFE